MDKIINLKTQRQAQIFFGPHDAHAKAIEKEFKVKISTRGEHLKISGTASNIKKASSLIEHLLESINTNSTEIAGIDLYHLIRNFKDNGPKGRVFDEVAVTPHVSKTKMIGPKTRGQREYVESIKNNDIVFGIGPAGTGKTYLAMACAVEALKKQEVRRIILTRPAVEAGESLGFLP
ncbi:MAG: hypothetical protein FJZ15_07245, partial [Candidatus Omnitrophica bacterium]|nr:hypothetical protein [Candidatus Omnitrophota bacterium]